VKILALGSIKTAVITHQLTRRNFAGDLNCPPASPLERDISQRSCEFEDWFDLVEDFSKHGGRTCDFDGIMGILRLVEWACPSQKECFIESADWRVGPILF
jgi:hypothetical protein